ncbi:hypothetical protein [Spiroplasma endosymbiont of Atherix ibis]|uniref:hypothetical protein n=1 Tax=Spiroplasma endosymbiont of Atherix ibis TaxID=3066291 RepID=UPI0030CA9AEF
MLKTKAKDDIEIPEIDLKINENIINKIRQIKGVIKLLTKEAHQTNFDLNASFISLFAKIDPIENHASGLAKGARIDKIWFTPGIYLSILLIEYSPLIIWIPGINWNSHKNIPTKVAIIIGFLKTLKKSHHFFFLSNNNSWIVFSS